ncbi:hypothetical protein [Streptomyces sp. NPDC048462]|uniref:hypothetical protein n=1 Tax=Streptomyces sp. NPDC048462 TaxID=3365555 RepID=UPI00371EE5C8
MTARPHRRRGRTVRARFLVRESPGVTVAPAADDVGGVEGRGALFDAARHAAERTLAEEGRGYLGGHLELRTPGGVGGARGPRTLLHAADRAAALAVTATLRGDDTGVTVRAARRPR